MTIQFLCMNFNVPKAVMWYTKHAKTIALYINNVIAMVNRYFGSQINSNSLKEILQKLTKMKKVQC